MSTFEFGFE